MESASPLLAPWTNFYVMTGSSAAALTGLMFVVITLVMGTERFRGTREGMSTFSTPTVVHFGAALFTSAILCAPWPSVFEPALLLGLAGLLGVVYALVILRRAWRMTDYRPDVEDWTWYSVLPLIAYAVLLAGAAALLTLPRDGLFAIAGSIVLLIVIGIHNAWDIVTYIAVREADDEPPQAT